MYVSTQRTEEEYLKLVSTPVITTQAEPVDLKALEASIKEDGVGFVTYVCTTERS